MEGLSRRTSYVIYRFCGSLFLIFLYILQTNARTISALDPHLNGNHLVSKILVEEDQFNHREKRAANPEIDNHLDVGLLAESNKDSFVQNVAIVLGVVSVFCLSTVALLMCIFCNSCDDNKEGEVGGANGYVGEINLGDIQVIYNPSAGAPRLPYTHNNEAFKSSQEDIVFGNPAILQVTSCEGINVRPSNPLRNPPGNQNRLVPGESKSANESHRLKDISVEQGHTIKLEYENVWAENQPNSLGKRTEKNSRIPETGKENALPSYALYQRNSVPHTNRSTELLNNRSVKEYDMNDFTIKNMHVRY